MRAVTGGEFILDQPDEIPAVWGDGSRVLMAEGEPLLIVAGPGVGKTTLGGQFAIRRGGLPLPGGGDKLLGLTVAPDVTRRTLYIAADRPRQIARSFRRMVADKHRHHLDRGLVFWPGPLPFDIVEDPHRMVEFAHEHDAGTIIIDGIADIASPLSEDRVGSRVKAMMGHVAAAGIELVGLYHPRKATSDGTRRPRTLDDVYGSTWITAGAGSVIYLHGDAGDPIVEMLHLKQPADVVGPLELVHDHDRGVTTVAGQETAFEILRAATNGGVTATEAAVRLFRTAEPARNEIEKARRKLDRLVRDKHAVKVPGEDGAPTLYRPVDHRLDVPEQVAHATSVTPREGSRDPLTDPHAPSRNGSTASHAGVTNPETPAPLYKGGPARDTNRDHLDATAEEEERAAELLARHDGAGP